MRRLAGPALLLFCAPLLVGFRWPWETSRLQKEARAAFEQQDYARADELWSDLYRDRSGDAALAYNLGTARLARGDYAGAMEVLGQGLERTRDPALLDQLHYNRGNAAFKMGDLERAAAEYEAALQAVPGDEDAAFNLELCRRQPPPPQGGGGDDPDEDQSPPQPQPGGAGTGDSTAPRQAGGMSEAEAEKTFVKQFPIGRLVEPKDIAPMVLFLASPHASAITGQSIAIDGGSIPGIFY